MALLALVIVATLAGLGVAFLARRLPRSAAVPAPAEGTRAHLKPEAIRGAALALALAVLVLGGLVLAMLTFVVRDTDGGLGVDVPWGSGDSATRPRSPTRCSRRSPSSATRGRWS